MDNIIQSRLFKDILPQVAKPARYTGDEVNIIRKDWALCHTKLVFVFPDVYEVGMSHVGGKILYGLVNETTEHLMERAFAPWPDMEALLRQEKIPLFSLESFKPIADFDVVGFSLQYELALTNCLNILDMSSIPLWAKDRGGDDPLVIAGGPLTFNPEPMADFFDAFLIGDGEELLPEVLDVWYKGRGLDRHNRMLSLTQIEGVYIPAFYKVDYKTDHTIEQMTPLYAGVPRSVTKRVVKDLNRAYFPTKPIVPYMEIIHDRAVVEVMRGCQRGCRFCHAGMVYRPVREKSVGVLQEQARLQLAATGYEEISLTSLSSLDYSGITPLVKYLIREYKDSGIGVALPSLRVDAFSIDLFNEVQKVRKTTLTLAPEAGSQRLRDVINKNVTTEQIFTAAEAAFKSGWKALKFYFMIGLPTEEEEDLAGIITLLNGLFAAGTRIGPRKAEIKASLSCFVPKAHTPFQWRRQNSIEEFNNKIDYLYNYKRKGVRLNFHDSKSSYIEGMIARGDRRLAAVIYRAWTLGAKFEGWSEYFRYERWRQAWEDCGVDPDFYVLRSRSYDEVLPWDFIDIGVTREYLRSEDLKAQSAAATGDCRWQECSGCGLCPGLEVEVDIRGES